MDHQPSILPHLATQLSLFVEAEPFKCSDDLSEFFLDTPSESFKTDSKRSDDLSKLPLEGGTHRTTKSCDEVVGDLFSKTVPLFVPPSKTSDTPSSSNLQSIKTHIFPQVTPKRNLSPLPDKLRLVFEKNPVELYQDLTTVDLNEQDIYSCETFADLIQERREEGLPYFLAIATEESDRKVLLDGTRYIFECIQYAKVVENGSDPYQFYNPNPTNRQKIKQAGIFIFVPHKPQPALFYAGAAHECCWADQGLLLKWMAASATKFDYFETKENLPKRGQERLALAMAHAPNATIQCSENEIKPIAYTVINYESRLIYEDSKTEFFWVCKAMQDGSKKAIRIFIKCCYEKISGVDRKLFFENLEKFASEFCSTLPYDIQQNLIKYMEKIETNRMVPHLYQAFAKEVSKSVPNKIQ